MDIRIIRSPSPGTIALLEKRRSNAGKESLDAVGAIGLVQGKLVDMIVAADIAQKAAGVTVDDIQGTCPQHMIVLAIFGDTASVEDAIEQIREQIQERK